MLCKPNDMILLQTQHFFHGNFEFFANTLSEYTTVCRRLATASVRRAEQRMEDMKAQEERRIKELQEELERVQKERDEREGRKLKGLQSRTC